MIAGSSHDTSSSPFLRMRRITLPWPHGRSQEDRAFYSTLSLKQLKETEVVAILLTIRCVQPHDSRSILSIDCLLAGAYSKKF
jgi:hypothetical protein